ncbi:hypothetical protein [Chryseobacterium wanjuense]
MLDLILMLIALAFGNNNANTSCNDNNGQVTTQLADPGGSTDPGTGTSEDSGLGWRKYRTNTSSIYTT